MELYKLDLIKGHSRIKEVLLKAYQSGRFPHALLFSGPSGSGKRSLAFAFASILISGGNPDDNTYSKIARNTHPDFIFMDKEWGTDKPGTSIKVEAIRALESRVRIGPHESEALVIVIDPADALTASSGNALLKTLEEPPESVHFFLITDSQEKLLPTIRSRCHSYRFSPLSVEELSEVLNMIHPEFGKAEIAKAASISEGSAETAGFLLNPGDFDPIETADKIINTAMNGSMKDIFDLAELLSKINRPSSIIILDIVKHGISSIIRGQYTANTKIRSFDLNLWSELINQAGRDLNGNVNQQLLWEHLLWTMRKS